MANRQRLLGPVLRDVSRAFYLTLRVLPPGPRETIGLAYLLARAADTLADTEALPAAERLERLLEFRAHLEGSGPLPLLGRPPGGCSSGEKVLLESLEETFFELSALPETDSAAVRRIVATLTRGMELDLRTFPPDRLGALDTPAQLDRYIYYVAGCVGEFWTEVTHAHTSRLSHWNLAEMSRAGVRFGKALQLTNVLRDVPRDLRNGRCYLPADQLQGAGLLPADLLQPASQARADPVLRPWIGVALEHYQCAQDYVLAIPWRCTRLRLAALWPVLIGLGTLSILAGNRRWLDPGHPSKVPRPWLYRTLALSLVISPFDGLLRRWFESLRAQTVKNLR